MPMRRVTLRQLRTFTTALRAGSFAGAAEVLHITPPAVTVQMRDLETIAGMPIIERSSSGLKSTDAGREIANAALRIEAAAAECADALAAPRGALLIAGASQSASSAPRNTLHRRCWARLRARSRQLKYGSKSATAPQFSRHWRQTRLI